MAFVQVIEFQTADYDRMREVEDEWERATEGKRTARRMMIGRDRNDPSRYLSLVFFDSYESAMQNSSLPETQASAERMAALGDGQPVFHDLEIIDDRSLYRPGPRRPG